LRPYARGIEYLFPEINKYKQKHKTHTSKSDNITSRFTHTRAKLIGNWKDKKKTIIFNTLKESKCGNISNYIIPG
jgi:hypothetical protein